MVEYIREEYRSNETVFLDNIFFVDERVLVPRKKTEDTTINAFQEIEKEIYQSENKINVIDVGTGSGAIIISIAKKIKVIGMIEKVNLIGIDISSKALEVAAINVLKHEVGDCVTLKESNLLENVKLSESDILIVNLPYLPLNSVLPKEVEEEPKEAVYDIGKGLQLVENLLQQIKKDGVLPRKIIIENSSNEINNLKYLVNKTLNVNSIHTYFDNSGEERGIIIKCR